MSKTVESVEEFLARGGIINHIPPGVGKDTPKFKTDPSKGVPRYAEKVEHNFNRGKINDRNG
jgi:hypothetical protein